MSGVSYKLEDVDAYWIEEAEQNADGTYAPAIDGQWYCAGAPAGLSRDILTAMLAHVGDWLLIREAGGLLNRPICRRVALVQVRDRAKKTPFSDCKLVCRDSVIVDENTGVPVVYCPTVDAAEYILKLLKAGIA